MSTPNNIKILVAEDDEVYGKVYLNKLTKEGYQVILVKDGKEAVEMTKKEKPNLILLDIIMPTMDGFEALKIIKSDPETKNIKVLVMSNLGQESDMARAKELGAEEYFVKASISISELIEKLKRYVGGV